MLNLLILCSECNPKSSSTHFQILLLEYCCNFPTMFIVAVQHYFVLIAEYYIVATVHSYEIFLKVEETRFSLFTAESRDFLRVALEDHLFLNKTNRTVSWKEKTTLYSSSSSFATLFGLWITFIAI